MEIIERNWRQVDAHRQMNKAVKRSEAVSGSRIPTTKTVVPHAVLSDDLPDVDHQQPTTSRSVKLVNLRRATIGPQDIQVEIHKNDSV